MTIRKPLGLSEAHVRRFQATRSLADQTVI